MFVDASADFVEPLIFTNIKVIVAGLFYERDYKSIKHTLILGFFSILCSCTTWCSKGTCSWSLDKLTVFHEERWEFQRFENLFEVWPTYCSLHNLQVAM